MQKDTDIQQFRRDSKVVIPAMMLPHFRALHYEKRGAHKNLLFVTWGGIGDQICSEPTLRWAVDNLSKENDISLASECPDLFRHLKFKNVFDLKNTPDEKSLLENYFPLYTITPPNDTNLVWQFFSHMITNCVDFPSLCALRRQLPIDYKHIKIKAAVPDSQDELKTLLRKGIVIHPGKHWPSKTFPSQWWNRVIAKIKASGITPIIIGKDTPGMNQGTVDVITDGCVDLRNKLTVLESIWLLQRASVLITNDSSPIHMAATFPGRCNILYVATCKHPDFITHWRFGKWQWRQYNFGTGGIWDLTDTAPNKTEEIKADMVDPKVLESWLPDPYSISAFAIQTHQDFKGWLE